ncbi:TIGR02677 family protein [uncultured Salinisphaera sp.]|uniref:TIGR02677 family protein n=1 Tax=uncultured Salinisphaera sp. TaxID=359372 RepID=UPI0032B22546
MLTEPNAESGRGETANLFRHVSAERGRQYRAVLEAFAAAKRQFRLHLRPDEVRAEAHWPEARLPSAEEVQTLLAQLVAWGNLSAQADMARVATIEDYYRAKFLYQLSREGEAVEAGMAAYAAALERRAELQTVALADIQEQLTALTRLADQRPLDDARIHQTLRELVHVFEGLAENAEDFMANLSRTVALQAADAATVVDYKDRLIDYLERFIGDLVAVSGPIAEIITGLEPADALLALAAEREARDSAPGDDQAGQAATERALGAWRERWAGLHGWFLRTEAGPSQAQRLRASARAAIPRLLAAIARVNERRSGRSDRAADYRELARWFADTPTEDDAHRLWRAAFALSPARHLALTVAEEVGASTPWRQAPAIVIEPTLRERGRLPSAGGPQRVRDRSAEKAYMAERIAAESAQLVAARERLITDDITRLSQIGRLDRHAFALFLSILGEALAAMQAPHERIERQTTDGSLTLTLEPIADAPVVTLETQDGVFSGRDHWIHIRPAS